MSEPPPGHHCNDSTSLFIGRGLWLHRSILMLSHESSSGHSYCTSCNRKKRKCLTMTHVASHLKDDGERQELSSAASVAHAGQAQTHVIASSLPRFSTNSAKNFADTHPRLQLKVCRESVPPPCCTMVVDFPTLSQKTFQCYLKKTSRSV